MVILPLFFLKFEYVICDAISYTSTSLDYRFHSLLHILNLIYYVEVYLLGEYVD